MAKGYCPALDCAPAPDREFRGLLITAAKELVVNYQEGSRPHDAGLLLMKAAARIVSLERQVGELREELEKVFASGTHQGAVDIARAALTAHRPQHRPGDG